MPLNIETVQPYLIPAAIAAFLIYRMLKYRAVKKLLPELKSSGGVVVDVRSRAEYSGGCCPGSINIPLEELASRAGELDRHKPVILCCASGARSGAAVGILKGLGFKTVVNAGPWQNAG